MAGTLEVTEELCWMPAGWVFDTVLERMAAELHPQEPALAARLLAARTEANGGYLDLRDVDLETLVLLVHAADRAYGRIQGERALGRRGPSLLDCSRSCNSSATCCRLGRRAVWRSGSGNSHANRVVNSMSCLPHDSVCYRSPNTGTPRCCSSVCYGTSLTHVTMAAPICMISMRLSTKRS